MKVFYSLMIAWGFIFLPAFGVHVKKVGGRMSNTYGPPTLRVKGEGRVNLAQLVQKTGWQERVTVVQIQLPQSNPGMRVRAAVLNDMSDSVSAEWVTPADQECKNSLCDKPCCAFNSHFYAYIEPQDGVEKPVVVQGTHNNCLILLAWQAVRQGQPFLEGDRAAMKPAACKEEIDFNRPEQAGLLGCLLACIS